MQVYEFKTELWLPGSPAEIFPFFADAANLDALTPPWLHFRIDTPLPLPMGLGALIDYRLRLHGVPLRWRTRITAWDPPWGFGDEQIHGPYRLWVHQHRFESRDGGTLASDHVRYAPRGGALVHRLFVRRDLERVFAYRAEALRRIFGDGNSVRSESR